MSVKKKQLEFRIKHETKQIVLSKSFSKKQSDIESPEYAKLCKVHTMFPDYDIVVKEIAKKEGKEAYKGLTYAFMEDYISMYGTAEDMVNFLDLRNLTLCHSVRFQAIKKWFLKKYPKVVVYVNQPELSA